ncbi:MAG: SH3 domain-containing protein [Roseibacillus sp.]
MKRALQIPLMGAMAVMVSSCGGLATSPNSQNFDPSIDPLDSPGRRTTKDTEPKYTPGSYLEVTDTNAVLYRRYPRGNAQPDQNLAMGTQLKVLGEQGSYVKVETEGGQIGFVPAIMVGTRLTGNELPLIPIDPSGQGPIDPIDPSGLTPLPPGPPLGGDPGFVAPDPEVPPISVEEAPTPDSPPPPIVPPDPVGNE